MPCPDNFSAAAFRRAHGDEAYDDAASRAEVWVAIDEARAQRLRQMLNSWVMVLEDMRFKTIFPAPGYEMEDLLGMMRDIRDKIDLDAYAKKAREIALDKELSR